MRITKELSIKCHLYKEVGAMKLQTTEQPTCNFATAAPLLQRLTREVEEKLAELGITIQWHEYSIEEV